MVLGRLNEKEKNKNVKLVSREGKLKKKIIFLIHFMTVFDIFLKGIHHINLVKIEDMK